MECPECRNEIPEGKLYCPTCGYAVQIVPDYDADLEENLSSVGSDIAGTVNRIDVQESTQVTYDEDSMTMEIPMVKKKEAEKIKQRSARYDEERQKLAVYAGAGIFSIILIFVSMMASKSMGNRSFVPVNAVDEVISEGGSMSAVSDDTVVTANEIQAKKETAEVLSSVSADDSAEEGGIELIVSPEGGSYKRPQGITAKVSIVSGADGMVQEDSSQTIYFTRDGSEPDENSEVYKSEIAMPVGRSRFAFRYMDEDGNLSDTLNVEYDLEYSGACSAADAANLIIATLIKDGALIDIYGHVAGSFGTYTYQCNSMISSGDRDYFLIPESFEEPGGSKKKTGKIYAVDAENLSMFTVSQGSDGKYSFEVFF